eukprot:TRINITY_DN11692_c0_g1_i1.p1 TRINITY_DN11692_c0_g1~~TRINITY_DN11692_c0_g1_i1.p1  ORF type:complete len:410 (-),score=94.87 TRINITY_DN11692_c0_g1_i1:81-1310(-)
MEDETELRVLESPARLTKSESSSGESRGITFQVSGNNGVSSETAVRVYLMDNSYKAFKVDVTQITIEELWEMAAEKLLLTSASAPMFFLFGVRGDLELLLYTHQKIGEVYRDWHIYEDRYNPADRDKGKTISRTLSGPLRSTFASFKGTASFHGEIPHFKSAPTSPANEPVKLVFRTTSVLPLAEEMKHVDPGAVHLFYTQAVYNVICSNYPCTIEVAIQLAGIQLQLTLGNKDPVKHKPGYLKEYIPQYIPEHLWQKMKVDEFEQVLAKEHVIHADRNKYDLQILYLSIVRQWKHYGCVFFKAKHIQQDTIHKSQFEGKVRLGVNENGIHIVDPREMKIVSHSYESIFDYNSEKEMFWFAAKIKHEKTGMFSKVRNEEKTFQFKSKQAELINDLICDWNSFAKSKRTI